MAKIYQFLGLLLAFFQELKLMLAPVWLKASLFAVAFGFTLLGLYIISDTLVAVILVVAIVTVGLINLAYKRRKHK